MNEHIVRRTAKAAAIARLNDRMRQAWGMYPNTKVLITSGIRALSAEDQSEIAGKVQKFDAFTEDNDPYGEHDFGSFSHRGHRVFWKIDYYAPDLMGGSEDPADQDKTVRVLTIMLALEY